MRPGLCVTLLVAPLLAGCPASTDGPSDGIVGDVTIDGAGFSDTGVEGFGNLDMPNSWEHLFGRRQEGDELRACRDQQLCGVGGAVDTFGFLVGANDSFAVVTTGDFRCTPSDFFDECQNPDSTFDVPVEVSGVGTFPVLVDTDDGQTWTGARLLFQYTLLSARVDPAGAQDSVVVRVRPKLGSLTRVFRLTASDLGSSLPLRSESCGTRTLPDTNGVATSYPSCSDWTEAEIDLTEFIGDSVRIEFVAGEAGAAIALALDEARIEVSR